MKLSKRKNFFVLLEILIAFFLVSITIFPFLRYPHNSLKKQMDLFFEMQLKNEGIKELAKMQVRLYRNDPDLLERIFGGKKTSSALIKNENFIVKLSPKIRRKYVEKIYLSWDKQKKTDDITSSLIKIQIKFYEKKNRRKPVSVSTINLVAQKKGATHFNS